MAMLSDYHSNQSSSNCYSTRNSYSRRTSTESSRRSNMQATAYAVNAHDMALTGFHFSTCGAGVRQFPNPPSLFTSNRLRPKNDTDQSYRGRSGGFEAPSGPPPPILPPSPPLSQIDGSRGQPRRNNSRDSIRGDAAAYHVKEECERLFCETLRTVFLVEKDAVPQNSLLMDAQRNNNNIKNNKGDVVVPTTTKPTMMIPRPPLPPEGELTPSPSPSPEMDGRMTTKPKLCAAQAVRPRGAALREYIEVWDYAAGARFRGFVAETDDGTGEKTATMFVFFDQEVIGMNLKPGLMSLLELASSSHFDCGKLVVGVDRTADAEDAKDLIRDLGWVGFELTLLDEWAVGQESCTSERWAFLAIDT